jgi:predicted nuclease with RNAse H fold
MLIVGLDLAGVESRPSGLCILMNMEAETSLVYKDEEVLKRIRESKPKIVAIDAPLSLPSGRESVEQRTNVHLRECDKELLRRGIKFFPVTLGPMRKLTSRGISLRRTLEKKHFRVIEVYPGGAQDILGIPRKQRGLERLRAGLEKVGIGGLNSRMSHHELDAVTCALVGKLFLENKAITYGISEQTIIMPKGEESSAGGRHKRELPCSLPIGPLYTRLPWPNRHRFIFEQRGFLHLFSNLQREK